MKPAGELPRWDQVLDGTAGPVDQGPASRPGVAVRERVPLGGEDAVAVSPQLAQLDLGERENPAFRMIRHGPMIAPIETQDQVQVPRRQRCPSGSGHLITQTM